jgi:biotin synthase
VVQVSTLLSIKQVVAQKTVAIVQQQDTTSVEGNDLMTVSQVKAQALRAKSGIFKSLYGSYGEM